MEGLTMLGKRIGFAAVALVPAAVAAAFLLAAPRHATIDAGIPVGEEVSLSSGGAPLAASLVLPPAAPRRAPGVVMLVGSGSYSYRTSWRPGEFPLWRYVTEAFLAKGYAVLLLEKKGVNRSGGHWEEQTFHDRADDAVAGARFLRGRPEVDPTRVGVCGHSQGGWIAQLAAAEHPGEIAFVVSLAGPNVSVKRQVLDDQENEWRCAGASEETIASRSRRLRAELDAYAWFSRLVKVGALSRILDYDPDADGVPSRIRCPILALYGEYDRLVIPEGNIPLLMKGVLVGGNPRATVVVVPKASHGFVRKTMRCPEEIPGIPDLAPEFYQALARWDPFAA